MFCKPIFEFILWPNCKNNCKFCFQKEHTFFNLNKKKDSIKAVITFLNTEEFICGSHLLLVGGELFDSKTHEELLKPLLIKILDKMLKNEIDLLYLNTNLIYKDISALDSFLKLIKKHNLFNRLKFTTSYDLEGRYKTEEHKQLFFDNLIKLKLLYPEINIVVNTILTKEVCARINNESFNVAKFCKDFQCDINLLPYIIYDESLSAKKVDIFTALQKVNRDNPGYLERYINNFDLPQNKLLYSYNGEQLEFCSCNNAECGHSINFKRYSQDNTCYVCDLKAVFNF